MTLLRLTVKDGNLSLSATRKNIGKFLGKAGDIRKVKGPFGLLRGHPAASPSAGKPELMVE